MFKNRLRFLGIPFNRINHKGTVVPVLALALANVSCNLFKFKSNETLNLNRHLVEPFRFTILHTNDLHSQFIGTGPDTLYTPAQDGDPVQGGYARIAQLVQNIRQEKLLKNEPVLLVDAGDFFAGSLFHTIAVSKVNEAVPELEFFSFLQYDAVSLGNHEFDATEKGFALMLDKAESKELNVPFVVSNERRSKDSPLERFYSTERKTKISEYLVKNLHNGKAMLTVCVFGALGPDAAFASANYRKATEFYGIDKQTNRKNLQDLATKLTAALSEARTQSNCQFNILVTHAGDPEDSELAEHVQGLDVIIAGHTHQKYFKKVKSGAKQVLVSQAGSHGSYLGKLELEVSSHAALALNESRDLHIPIDDSIQSSNEVTEHIESYKSEIKEMNQNRIHQNNNNPFYSLELGFDSPIVTVDRDKPFEREYPNNLLAGYLFDRIKSAANRCIAQRAQEPADAAQDARVIDIYFSTLSLVRSSFLTNKGKPVTYQYSDVFKFFSIGFDEELQAGNPVYHFYLKKTELKLLTEFFEIYRYVTPLATPGFSSNFRYSVRKWGLPLFNRISGASLDEKEYQAWPELVHMATNRTILSYLEKISSLSRGFVNLKPRNAAGELENALRLPCLMKEHELLTAELLASGY